VSAEHIERLRRRDLLPTEQVLDLPWWAPDRRSAGIPEFRVAIAAWILICASCHRYLDGTLTAFGGIILNGFSMQRYTVWMRPAKPWRAYSPALASRRHLLEALLAEALASDNERELEAAE
jgi:hypothetical protein